MVYAGGRDDPSADERWQAGLDYGMERFCSMLGVDPKDVRWDAATEELDGDVCAVIGNILRVKFGDDFDPMKPLPAAGMGADEIARASNWKLVDGTMTTGESVIFDGSFIVAKVTRRQDAELILSLLSGQGGGPTKSPTEGGE